MAVTKAQHGAHTNMISKIAKFFGPKTASASSFRSTIPGYGQPYNTPKPAITQSMKPFVSSLPKNQKTFGVPGAK